MKVLLSGASGFVGSHIIRLLLEQGHQVYALSRNPEKNKERFPEANWLLWEEGSKLPDLRGLEVEGVINLAGENLASKRWSNGQKKEIYNSRIDGTRNLFQALKEAGIKPSVFVSTSAIGIYGDRGEEVVDENSLAQEDFLGVLCKAWEEEVHKHQQEYERAVILRVGLVLGKGGGLAEKLVPLFKLGLGGKLANGNFYMSWIHVKDLARIYVKALNDGEMKGIYNAVSPFSVKNVEFTRVLAQVCRKPAFFTVPKAALKLAMGEMGEYVLKSAKVAPKRLKEEDFHYFYPTIEVALKDVVSKT